MARHGAASRAEEPDRQPWQKLSGLVPDAEAGLDRLIHERVRLGIVSALAVNESLSFKDLKQLMDLSDGNLSVHSRKLEDAGYVVCTKSFEGRMPKTEYRLTPEGRAALERYLRHMESLIQVVRDSGEDAGSD